MDTLINFMKTNSISHMIWNWEDFPYDEKYELSHGGDEDFVIIAQTALEPWEDIAAEKLTVCDFLKKDLQKGFVLYVTAHS